MRRRSTASIALHAVLVLGAAATLTPLFWMLVASFMPAGEANSAPPRIWPSRFVLEHYIDLFTRLDLARKFFNSAFVTISVTVLSVLINAMAGYALAKLRFAGRERLFRFLMTALLVPAQVAMLPLFLLLKQMGFVNTYVGVMIPGLASVFGIFLVRQYMSSIPTDLLDAARVDGAGEFRIFWTIVLPVVKPILATLGVFSFLGAWNDFMWPLVILSDDAMYTLPVAISSLAGEHVQDTELMMAGSVLTVLPVLIVFLVLQKSYIQGIMAGSVKE